MIIEDDVVFTKDFKAIISSLASIKHEKDAIYDLEFVPRNHLMAKSSSRLLDGRGASITKMYQKKRSWLLQYCPFDRIYIVARNKKICTGRFVCLDTKLGSSVPSGTCTSHTNDILG